MGVLRPRNRARKRSRSASRGSMPPASKPRATLSRPKRRGSTKRSSLPEASFRMACVCLRISDCGSQTCRRPVMPRWTIHWAWGLTLLSAGACCWVRGLLDLVPLDFVLPDFVLPDLVLTDLVLTDLGPGESDSLAFAGEGARATWFGST